MTLSIPTLFEVLDGEIHSFGFHIITNDTLAAGTVPPIALKIRNHDELLLIAAELAQARDRPG